MLTVQSHVANPATRLTGQPAHQFQLDFRFHGHRLLPDVASGWHRLIGSSRQGEKRRAAGRSNRIDGRRMTRLRFFPCRTTVSTVLRRILPLGRLAQKWKTGRCMTLGWTGPPSKHGLEVWSRSSDSLLVKVARGSSWGADTHHPAKRPRPINGPGRDGRQVKHGESHDQRHNPSSVLLSIRSGRHVTGRKTLAGTSGASFMTIGESA